MGRRGPGTASAGSWFQNIGATTKKGLLQVDDFLASFSVISQSNIAWEDLVELVDEKTTQQVTWSQSMNSLAGNHQNLEFDSGCKRKQVSKTKWDLDRNLQRPRLTVHPV